MNPVHLYLDATLIGIAMFGVVAFILLDRPRLHVALLFSIALLWAIELTIVLSHNPNAPAIYTKLHPIISIATTIAALAIVLTRRLGKRS